MTVTFAYIQINFLKADYPIAERAIINQLCEVNLSRLMADDVTAILFKVVNNDKTLLLNSD